MSSLGCPRSPIARWSRAAVWSALALVLVARTPSAAAEEPYQTPDYIREPASLPPDVGGQVRQLTLADAIRTAVANNLGVVLSREQLAAQRYSLAAARGGFEPELSASMSHSDSVSPPSTAQAGSAGSIVTDVDDGWNIGLSQELHTGTTISIDMTNTRASSSGGTAVEPLIYRSALGLHITQPLLKGFSLDREVPKANILRAEFSTERARDDMRLAISETVKSTEDAYWDLVQALKSYHVQMASLELAREQVRLTQRQIAAGVMAPVDLINAESTLAQRELSMVQAGAAIESAADRLRQVLNLPEREWGDPLLPAEAPNFAPSTVGLDDAISTALARRPEVSQRKLDVRRADLDVHLAKNDQLPQLDVSFGYGLVGQEARYRTTLADMMSFDARAWTAAVTLSWAPLGRAARGQLESLQASRHSSQLQLEREMLTVRVEVREAIRDIDTAARQVRAAAKFRALAEQNLDAEQRKFMNGTSSNFFVAQRQDELARAQLSELAAVIQHHKAITNLELVCGTILDKRQIRLEVAGRPTRRDRS